jgi:serine phosphatase RsbU (regulator of sigma subunit)
MSLAATIQWDLLPPLTLSTSRVSVAGLLEPAYEVGGDSFDYAMNGSQLDLVFMDAMGHGVRSATLAALAIGCYRHDRRESRTLDYMHQSLDAAIATYGGNAFVTGQIARLDVETGTLKWTNAGHPLPMLIRQGRVIGELTGRPTGPWGTGYGTCEVYEEALEPGDSLLFYTDGITERQRGRVGFGSDRLVDLVDRNAFDGVPVALMARNIVRAVVDYHEGILGDDATIFIVRWASRG